MAEGVRYVVLALGWLNQTTLAHTTSSPVKSALSL